MAVTRGHAWNSQTIDDSAWTPLLPSGSSCEEVVLSVDEASAEALLVAVECDSVRKNVPTLNSIHRFSALGVPVEHFVLAIEAQIPFAASVDNRITQIYVKGDGGTATFSGTVTKA